MKYILKYLKPYQGRVIIGSVIKFLGTIMDLILPWILAHLIDDIVPLGRIGEVVLWGGVMIVVAFLGFFGNVKANRMASAVARDAARNVRHDLFDRILHLSGRQIDAFTVPSLESRLTSDTYNVHQMLGQMQRIGFRAPILLIGGLIVTALFEPVLTLVIIAILPFIGFIVFRVAIKGIPMYADVQKSSDRMVSVVRENVQGIRVIKALSKKESEKARYDHVNRELGKKETAAGLMMGLTNPLMTFFLNLGMTGVILVGAYRISDGLTEPGKIIAFLSYFTIILNAMLSVSRVFVMYSKGTASANRIGEILDAPEDLTVIEDPEPGKGLPAHLCFDHVSFSYTSCKDQLTDISFSVPRGGSLGIIGATGSGKSTVIKLLERFYDADEGRISIGGRDVRSIPKDELYSMFGSVMQNDVIFEETVAENISFGRDIPPEQIRKAAAEAQASEFIERFEDGYDHMLTSRGTNVSGGQKQRLLIARALAGKPEILILDDSSSALDYQTDANLRKALREREDRPTTILVAQRVSSLSDCDMILVLDEGRIVGYGTSEELLSSCTIFREIRDTQMGGMIVD